MLNTILSSTNTYAEWITIWIPIVRMILVCLIALCAITIIVLVLWQDSNAEGGTNVISGSYESFYSRNKGSSREGRLKTVMIISSALIAVVSILFFITYLIYPAA